MIIIIITINHSNVIAFDSSMSMQTTKATATKTRQNKKIRVIYASINKADCALIRNVYKQYASELNHFLLNLTLKEKWIRLFTDGIYSF